MDSLLILSECQSALSEAKTLTDVLAIRDRAEMVRHAAKVRGAGIAAMNEAAEVKLHAERLAGQALSKMQKNGGARGVGVRSRDVSAPTLKEIGVAHNESAKWQRIAALPQKQFDAFVSETKDAGQEITTAAVLRLGRAAQNCEPIMPAVPVEGVTDDLQSLIDAGLKFGTIYADPPWRYSNTSTRANVEGLYAGTMSAAEVCNMPVKELAADDAHLHLWTTNAFLREAFDVIDAWGFEYRSLFVWCKPQMGIGNYWRVSHEFLLLGIRGDAKRFAEHNHMSWGVIDRGEHSAKPDEVRGIIEKVSPGPFLELFGRQPIAGWQVFGNQVDTQRLFSA